MSQKENNEKIKAGSNLRGLLNDLKRRPEDAARELDFPIEELMHFLKAVKMSLLNLLQKPVKNGL